MDGLALLLGAVAGLGSGWLAWIAAGRFILRYQVLETEQETEIEPTAEKAGLPVGGSITPLAGLVLASMTALGIYVGWQASALSTAVAAFVVTTLLLTITLVDFQVRRIPNELVLALLLWAVFQSLWLGQPTLVRAALGLATGGGLFLLLALIGRGAMGMGDVKLAAAIGAFTGFPQVWVALATGIIAGGVAALILLLSGRAGRKDPIAYGPYLALGAWVVVMRSLGLW